MELHAMQWVDSLSQVAARSFVSGIWQGALLAAGVGLCLRLMPKMTAALRFSVWTAVFLVIVLLPFLHLSSTGAHPLMSAPGAILQMDIRWSFGIAAVWLLLSLVRAVKLAMSILQLRGLWQRAIPVKTGAGSVSLPTRFGSRTAQLCTSAEVDRPSVIGFFSPRILIPLWLFEKLTPAELEQIVLHEMGHLSRADDWINLLQKIGLVLFPLNPVLMWIERRLCFERELACDDGVLRVTKAATYASCLTSLAENRLARRSVSLSLGAWERQSELARRIHIILRRGESMNQRQARMVLSGMVLVLVAGAAGLSRCPQLVSFSARSAAVGAIADSPAQMQSERLPAAEYRPVVFHPSEAPHATLLKVSLPLTRQAKPIGQKTNHAPRKKSHPAPAPVPAVQHAKGIQARTQQWVVLTSWDVTADESGASKMTLTVTDERLPMPRYAAVPTINGWLVIQL
jgi:hypothetical protein